MDQTTPKPDGFSKRLRKSWPGLLFLCILVGMIAWIVVIGRSDWDDKASWLLVPLTAVYSILTLFIGVASFQNAKAALRSARAMEESVAEQRLSRWAAFAAVISFPRGYRYSVASDGRGILVLGNPLRKPIIQLQVKLWEMEAASVGDGLVKYSTMMESDDADVEEGQATVTIELRPSILPEQERVRLGNLAIERFRTVNQGVSAKATLCLITLRHLAQPEGIVLVYELERQPGQAGVPPDSPQARQAFALNRLEHYRNDLLEMRRSAKASRAPVPVESARKLADAATQFAGDAFGSVRASNLRDALHGAENGESVVAAAANAILSIISAVQNSGEPVLPIFRIEDYANTPLV